MILVLLSKLQLSCLISLLFMILSLQIFILRAQVALLEWTDDVEVFILKGYGNSLNYKMGVPLLEDIVQSMEQAIKAKEGILYTYVC